VKVVQELLRHSSSKMTLDVYAQALTPTKRVAQRRVVAMIREDLSVPWSVPRKLGRRSKSKCLLDLASPTVCVRNFDTAQGKLYIPPHIAKNKKARHIVLDSEARQFFFDRVADRPPDEPIFLKDQRKGSAQTKHNGSSSNGPRVHPLQWGQSEQARPMREACLRAELEPFPFYTLRHSCAARWLTAGASMKEVADQLGNSVSICERYYGHVSESHSTKVMRAMPPLKLTACRGNCLRSEIAQSQMNALVIAKT
jgi:integrase